MRCAKHHRQGYGECPRCVAERENEARSKRVAESIIAFILRVPTEYWLAAIADPCTDL